MIALKNIPPVKFVRLRALSDALLEVYFGLHIMIQGCDWDE